jgi:hypothetical protein
MLTPFPRKVEVSTDDRQIGTDNCQANNQRYEKSVYYKRRNLTPELTRAEHKASNAKIPHDDDKECYRGVGFNVLLDCSR